MTARGKLTEALALSGGGCYGAYQVGVMRALLSGRCPATSYQPADPHVLLGTSIGSLNVALLLSAPEQNLASAVDYVEQTWLDTISSSGGSGNGLLCLRGSQAQFLKSQAPEESGFPPISQLGQDAMFFLRDWFHRGLKFFEKDANLEERFLELFDIGSLISVQPLVNLINTRVFPDLVRESGRKIRIPATNWRTGQLRIFTEEDMTPEIGRLVVQASTAMPGLFPSVDIQGEPYADGGLHMNTPLEPAISLRADVIHAVYMDPDASSIALPKVRNTFSSIYRMAVIAWSGVIQRDIEIAANINRGIELLENGAREDLGSHDIKSMLSALGRHDPDAPHGYRKITVHRYYPESRPREKVRWLNFGRAQVTRLIGRGFEDTVGHDCLRNKCVLPQINRPDDSLKRLAESLPGRHPGTFPDPHSLRERSGRLT